MMKPAIFPLSDEICIPWYYVSFYFIPIGLIIALRQYFYYYQCKHEERRKFLDKWIVWTSPQQEESQYIPVQKSVISSANTIPSVTKTSIANSNDHNYNQLTSNSSLQANTITGGTSVSINSTAT